MKERKKKKTHHNEAHSGPRQASKIEPSIDIPEFLDSGRKSWTLDSGRWTLDA